MARGKRIKDSKKEMLFSELHSLLTSGLSFSRSFELLIRGEKHRNELLHLQNIYNGVLQGESLWKSMEMSGGFVALDCGVIRIGEETGGLDRALSFLGDYYRKKIARRRMLSGALSYPLIVMFTAVIVLVFMLAVVVPMFEQVYVRMGGELPGLTRMVIAFSSAFPVFLFILGCLSLCLIGIKTIYGERDFFQKTTSRMLLKIPVAGTLIKKDHQARFCKLLYLLYSAGVPLLHSLELLAGIIRFYPFRRSFESICEGLMEGDLFADRLAAFPDIYDLKMVTLFRVGEETNCLDKVLLKQSEDITAELEHRLKQLGAMLEPALVVGIGFIVAFILIAMYLPIFKLGTTIH